MAEKTLEERLSELYEKTDHRDQFFDKDLKTLIEGIRDAREHGGSSDYTELDNKPAINGVTLMGDQTAAQLGLATANQVEVVSNKVDKLPSGYYYGKFNSVEDLPEATEKGYAYVASSDPTVFYTYLVSGAGAEWVDSGNKMVNTVDLTTPKTTETELSKGEKYFASANINDRPAVVVIETGVVKSLGYKVLNPNLSFAEHVTDANTIYEIKDSFDLGGGSVTIPAGCTLKFNGGKLTNGTLIGNYTTINADEVTIFSNLILTGTFANAEAYLSWWDVTPYNLDNQKDNQPEIQRAISSPFYKYIIKHTYGVGTPILMESCVLVGDNIQNFSRGGFCAIDGFASRKVTDKRNPSNTVILSGIICHWYDTFFQIDNFLIDGRYKAKYGIQSIKGSSQFNSNDCHIKNCTKCGILQYACEKPTWNKLYIRYCNVGMYVGGPEFNEDNPINFEGQDRGACNMLTMNDCRVQNCNYGIIKSRGSDWYCTHLETAHNHRVGLYIAHTQLSINDWYTEGDGRCEGWITNKGQVWNANNSPVIDDNVRWKETCKYAIDNNLDGFKYKFVNLGEYYYRAVAFVGEGATMNVGILYASNKRRSSLSSVTSAADCNDYSVRTGSGIDAVILSLGCLNIQIDNVRYYNHSNGSHAPMDALPYLSFIGVRNGVLPNFICNNMDGMPLRTLIVNGFESSYISISSFQPIPLLPYSSRSIVNANKLWENNLRSPGNPSNKSYIYENVYKGIYGGFPCYRLNSTIYQAGNYRIEKTDFENLFGSEEQLGIMLVMHVNNTLTTAPYLEVVLYNGSARQKRIFRTPVGLSGVKSGETYKVFNFMSKNYPDITYDHVRFTFENFDTDNCYFSVPTFFTLGTNVELIQPYNGIPKVIGQGSSTKRPAPTNIGFPYFDTTLKKPIFWNGMSWIAANGDYIFDNSGTLQNRLAIISPVKGQQFKLTREGETDVYLIYGSYGWLKAADGTPWSDDTGTLNAMYDKYNYTLLTAEPSNWSTAYNTYYKIVDGVYTKLNALEPWASDTYYKLDVNAYKGIQVKLTDTDTELLNKVVKWNGTKYINIVDNTALKAGTPVVTFTTENNTTTAAITSTSSGKIYYTKNGDAPTSSSTKYSSAITLADGDQVKAICIRDHMDNSDPGYVPVSKPEITFSSAGILTITCNTPNAKIYYTIDGSEPSTASTEYDSSASVTIAKGVTVNAIAVLIGRVNSEKGFKKRS